MIQIDPEDITDKSLLKPDLMNIKNKTRYTTSENAPTVANRNKLLFRKDNTKLKQFIKHIILYLAP